LPLGFRGARLETEAPEVRPGGCERLQWGHGNKAVETRWNDIVVDDGRIIVRDGKGGTKDEVFVPEPCMEAVQQLALIEQAKECDHPYVFHYVVFVRGIPFPVAKKSCEPITRGRAYDVVVCIGEGVGMRLHPHMLRHSIATAMVNHGAPLPFVQRHLRHANPETTLVYYHLDSEAQRNSVRSYVRDVSPAHAVRPRTEVDG